VTGQQFYFHAEPDQSRPTVEAYLIPFLQKLPAAKSWKITVEPYRKPRTDTQNATLWRAYGIIGETLGFDHEDLEALHEDMLCAHFGYAEKQVMGRLRRMPYRRSSQLTTVEFAEFYDHIVRKAAEFGVLVPDPDPMLGKSIKRR